MAPEESLPAAEPGFTDIAALPAAEPGFTDVAAPSAVDAEVLRRRRLPIVRRPAARALMRRYRPDAQPQSDDESEDDEAQSGGCCSPQLIVAIVFLFISAGIWGMAFYFGFARRPDTTLQEMTSLSAWLVRCV